MYCLDSLELFCFVRFILTWFFALPVLVWLCHRCLAEIFFAVSELPSSPALLPHAGEGCVNLNLLSCARFR